MKIAWMTYGNDKYATIVRNMADGLYNREIFDELFAFRQWDIPKDYYNNNRFIFGFERGAGFWCWKPALILKALSRMDDGDVLLYLDAGDALINENKNIYSFLKTFMAGYDILLTRGAHPQFKYTKKDCFAMMGCDYPIYHNAIQVEAGIIVVKKTKFTIDFLREWMLYCQVPQIITDLPNVCGENYDGFVDHRHDQSILSNLAVKHNVYVGTEMRSYIYCNQKEPE